MKRIISLMLLLILIVSCEVSTSIKDSDNDKSNVNFTTEPKPITAGMFIVEIVHAPNTYEYQHGIYVTQIRRCSYLETNINVNGTLYFLLNVTTSNLETYLAVYCPMTDITSFSVKNEL